ncbi:low temperature requirement protein A [Furfurilactobacillus sp. WILCCON 0119]
MKELRQNAEVSNLELFYDLIFAYAISRITTILHLVHHEEIPGLYLGEYLIMFFMFWTIWTYQTVLVNRFFHENLQHTVFMLFDMFMVIILSQSLNADFEATHLTFAGSTSILLISIGIQYWLQSRKLTDQKQLVVARGLYRLLFLSGLIGAATIVPWASYGVRVTVYVLSMVLANVGPIFLYRELTDFPAIFEHLTERYSLFTLLLFGEAVIAVASIVDVHDFNWLAIPFFLIIVALFMIYFVSYQGRVNRHKKTAGITLINVHYFIFVGLDLVTAATELYLQHELIGWQFAGLVSLGLAGFLGGILVMVLTYPNRPLTHSPWISGLGLLSFVVILGAVVLALSEVPVAAILVLSGVLVLTSSCWWFYTSAHARDVIK